MKCLFKIKDYTIREEVERGTYKDFLFINQNNEIDIKQTHNYFYQIQGQLIVLKRKFCCIVLHTNQAIVVVHFVEDFYSIIILKLAEFYKL